MYNVLPGLNVVEDENKGIIPEFYIKTKQNGFKSKQAGRPIFDEVEYIKIIIAGDRNSVIDRPASDIDKQRFSKRYEIFKSGTEITSDPGTPIEQWPMVTRGRAEELKHMNVHTVESLAELSDTAIQNMGMGTRALVEQAKTFLAVANETADMSGLVAENISMKSELDLLKGQIADLSSHMRNYDDLSTKVGSLEIENANLKGSTTTFDPDPIPVIPELTPEPEVEPTQNYETMTRLALKSLLGIRGVKYKQRDTLEDLQGLARGSET